MAENNEIKKVADEVSAELTAEELEDVVGGAMHQVGDVWMTDAEYEKYQEMAKVGRGQLFYNKIKNMRGTSKKVGGTLNPNWL